MNFQDLMIYGLLVILGLALLIAVIRSPRTAFIEIPVWIFRNMLDMFGLATGMGIWIEVGKLFFTKSSDNRKCITKTQLELGIVFPKVFKDKMMVENGGEIKLSGDSWMIYLFSDNSGRGRTRRFSQNIAGETKNVRKWSNFPAGAVAIAENDSGDRLVFLPGENVRRLCEAIYVWRRETGDITLLAKDIHQLM